MLAILGILLIVAWLIGLAFKVTVGIFHLAVVLGVILLIAHFVTGRRGTATP